MEPDFSTGGPPSLLAELEPGRGEKETKLTGKGQASSLCSSSNPINGGTAIAKLRKIVTEQNGGVEIRMKLLT